MKPESIKCVLKTYLKERESSLHQPYVSSEPPEYMPDCDDTPKAFGDYISGEPLHCMEDRLNDLLFVEPQLADPFLDELNAPLEPQEERLAAHIGRRLRGFAYEFNINVVNNQAPANGNGRIQFKENILRIPSTCDCIKIPVARTGGVGGIVNAGWTTHNKSAKAGIHYVNSQGNISFDQSEEEKTIEVKMISDREEEKDIYFTVELFDARGTFNTVTVYIVDDSYLYPEEKRFITNIFKCAGNIPMSEIVTRLVGNVVTHNTFKAALQCVCSNADSISKEFALASELFRLTMYHAPLSTLTNAFCDFFRYLPELEDFY